MNVKGFSYRAVFSLLLAAGMAASCTMYYVEEPVTNKGGNGNQTGELSLALSVTSNNMPRTKMQDNVTQSANTGSGTPTAFRGLQDMHILPFRRAGSGGKESPVQGADRVHSEELELPYTGISSTFTNTDWTAAKTNGGLVANNFGHLYEGVSVPSGTASVTVYAKATEAAEPTDADALRTHRKTYGALTDKFSTAIESAGDVTFQPVPIMESTGTELNTLVSIMNRFIGISGSNNYYYRTSWRNWSGRQTVTVSWNGNSGNTSLNNYFNAFTNNGEIISGAGNSIEHLLSQFYSSLQSFSISGNYTDSRAWDTDETAYQQQNTSNPLTLDAIYGSGNNGLKKKLLDVFTALRNEGMISISGTTVTLVGSLGGFPSSLGVPEGSVAIKWDGSEFIIANENSGTRLVPVEDYCYPPSLWYHTNSTLSVLMQEEEVESYYTQANDWDAILANYTDGKVVYSAATAAAIDLPLQYGPALFTFSFTSADGTSLKDADNENVSITNGSFPVTGIIIGEQREQSFQFHPLQGKIYYLWDSYVLSEGGTGDYKAYIKNGTQQPVSTLVLETEENEDVHYAVEFLNNSGTTFAGASGNILPGSKFYLTGTLKLSDATSGSIDSIFKQDCQTLATFKVTTLASAYNTVPDLQNPQLEIGVQVHMDWILDTPSEMPLY